MDNSIKPRIALTREQVELRQKMLDEVGRSDYRAVSFRLTGTLISNAFPEFEDIFMLMEEDFRSLTTV